jgi:hypothetical protein
MGAVHNLPLHGKEMTFFYNNSHNFLISVNIIFDVLSVLCLPSCLPPLCIPSKIFLPFLLYSYMLRACPICLPTYLPIFCIPSEFLHASSPIQLLASEHALPACTLFASHPKSCCLLTYSAIRLRACPICLPTYLIYNPACFPSNATICHSMPQLHALLHCGPFRFLKFRSVTICPPCLYPCLSPPPPPHTPLDMPPGMPLIPL